MLIIWQNHHHVRGVVVVERDPVRKVDFWHWRPPRLLQIYLLKRAAGRKKENSTATLEFSIEENSWNYFLKFGQDIAYIFPLGALKTIWA